MTYKTETDRGRLNFVRLRVEIEILKYMEVKSSEKLCVILMYVCVTIHMVKINFKNIKWENVLYKELRFYIKIV